MTKRKKLLVLLATVTGISLWAKGAAAYQTAFDLKKNQLRVGYNHTEIGEEFPSPTPFPGDRDEDIKKKVWVTNRSVDGKEGSTDCYVRVALVYSNSDIGKAVILKNLDEANWKNGGDGFYYYKTVLKDGQSTTPLFDGMTIKASQVQKEYLDDIEQFEVQVYEESVSAEGYDDYKSAWEHYTERS